MLSFVQTENVKRLFKVAELLWAADSGEPRMALVFGPAGRGKTRALDHLVAQTGAAFVSAVRVHTPASLLKAICREVGAVPAWSAAESLNRAAETLRERSSSETLGRGLLIVDEADYLTFGCQPPATPPLLDCLRDLHDASGAPILLAGMSGLAKTLSFFPQFWDRLLVAVEFEAVKASEVEKIGKELVGLKIPTPVCEDITRCTAGTFRQVILYLVRLARAAKAKGTDTVSREMVLAVEGDVSRAKAKAARGSGLRRIK